MAITADTKYEFLFGTLAEYKAAKTAGKIDACSLYFITDTKELYIGEEKYFEPAEVVDSFPAAGAQGKLYINGTTYEAKIFDGTKWVVISPAVSTELTAETEGSNIVTAEAVREYVKSAASDNAVVGVGYDGATQKITVTKGSGSTEDLLLKNLFTNVTYDGTTGALTFVKANKGEGETDLVVNMPVENFLANAEYDHETTTITLTMESGETLEIPIGDLVDVYTVADTNSVDMTMTGNEIKADVKISAEAGNLVQIKEDGLFVENSFVKSVEDTNTVDLEVTEAGVFTADVKISAKDNNAIQVIEEEGKVGLHVDITGKLDKNEAITGATKCKITYDAKGLVTAGADLTEDDIPELHLAKITDVTATADEVNVLDGIDVTTEELNRLKGLTDDLTDLLDGKADKATTLAGYGIEDAYTKTEIDAMHTWKAIASV